MGILDDAIREHLDLKRKHGARDAELQQLEDEAFGPPSRPDEPDFPDRPPTGEHPQESVAVAEEPDHAGPGGALEGAPAPVVEDDEEAEAQVFYDQAGNGEAAREPEAIAGEPTAEHEMVFEDEDGEADEVPVAEALEPAPAAPPPEPPPLEPPLPAAPPETEDADPDAEFEIGEIELEIDEEFEEFRETGDEAAEPLSDEHELVEPPSDEHEAVAPAPAEGDEEEDVLEETPEFLRGTPEDERLWFEQRPPQDFDFEDEDEGTK